MLEKLHIKNFALIDELEVEFGRGLNVLTGETGAGKSIIFDAINFVLGEKADKNQIKTGADNAEVWAMFTADNDYVSSNLEKCGVEIGSDGSVLIERSFNTDGKSTCKINGRPATVTMLKNASFFLVDIHGQNDQQSLLKSENQLVILDRFCGDEVNENVEKIQERYKGLKETMRMLADISGNDAERQAAMDTYKAYINEIKAAKLKPNEEEELDNKRDVLANGVNLRKYTDEALNILYRDENGSASDKIAQAAHAVGNIAKYDASKLPLEETLESLSAQLEGVIEALRSFSDSIEDDPKALDDMEQRLQDIHDLKRKYGKIIHPDEGTPATVEEINEYVDKAEEKLMLIENSADMIMEYQIRKEADERIINKIAEEVSAVRKEVATKLGKQVEDALYDLGMINAVFNISVTPDLQINERGRDKVDFLLSANLGEEPKPLNKIASGGEMSRVMLALKVILADVVKIDTFVFDEIDTGISGRTAQRVAEKMANLSRSHQLLCITHLPQIAAMADKHYLIDKVSNGDETTTTVKPIDGTDVDDEIARLIGGAKITDSTIEAASEMKAMATKFKARF